MTEWIGAERGAAVIEMAVAAPFMITLGFGTFEFGCYFYHYHLMSTGLHDAARYLARTDNPIGQQDAGKQLAVYGKLTSGVDGQTKRISWWRTEDITVSLIAFDNPIDSNGQSPYRGGTTINVVNVATNVTHPGLGLLSALGIKQPLRINLAHQERHIGD